MKKLFAIEFTKEVDKELIANQLRHAGVSWFYLTALNSVGNFTLCDELGSIELPVYAYIYKHNEELPICLTT